MHIRCAVIAFILAISFDSFAFTQSDFIKVEQKKGRYLFHSKKFGSFFSVGSNSFMESHDNLQMKEAFKAKPFSVIYEEQIKSYSDFGFNSLGGWSNTEFLKGRLPYGVMLFDDDEYPRSAPLKDCKGNVLPSGDAKPLPNPFNDPFDPSYKAAIKKYIKEKVRPHANDPALLLYWIGHEFGIGGSDSIDLAIYTYSSSAQMEFASWLKMKYEAVGTLQKAWNSKEKSFKDVVKECPRLKSDRELVDRKEFMAYTLRKWFELVVGEIRKNDSRHLISTPKFSVWDHQPQLELAENDGHFEAMSGLFDVFSVDWYARNPKFSEKSFSQITKMAAKLKLPILVAEFGGIRQKMDGWTNSKSIQSFVNSQEERGEYYKSQLLQLFENGNFIGAHWFRWQDRFNGPIQSNIGIVSAKDGLIGSYEPLKKAMSQVHKEIAVQIQPK